MKADNFNSQSYIHQASSFYDGLVNGELKPYSSIVFACLHDKFSIRTIDDIKILKAVVSSIMYAKYVYLKKDVYILPIDRLVSNFTEFIFSCDKKDHKFETHEFECVEIAALKSNLISYRNHYVWTYITKKIIDERQRTLTPDTNSFTLCNHDKWSDEIVEEFTQITNYHSIVSFCVSYMYYTEKDVVTKHFQVLPLKFYHYVIKSILKAEYLYIPDYKNIFKKYNDNDNDNVHAVLPDVVTYGIEPIREVINKCDHQYGALLATSNDIKKNFYFDTYIDNKFHRPKYKNEQVSVETGQWIPIVEIIKLAYEASFIEIAYISSSHNIRILMSLFKGIKDLNSYYQKNSNILSIIDTIENKLWKEVEELNQILCLKVTILLSQIIEQKSPEDDSSMMPRFHYNIPEETIQNAIKDISNIKIDDNPFIEFCENPSKYDIKTIEELFNKKSIIPLYKTAILDYSGINKYNEFINYGLELSIGQTPIYIAIKKLKVERPKLQDEKDFINCLTTYIANKSNDILLKVVPPSLYVKSIKCLCKITNRHINSDVSFAKRSLDLLDRILGLLRLATLAYKDQSITPYRFRPLFEYSFYEYSNQKLLLVNAYEYDNFIEYLTYTDNVLFLPSFIYPHPVNYNYLENFFFCYNRIVHQYHHEINQKFIEHKSEDLKENADSKMNEERKKTIQLLGIFGTFIAFVSSVAGMIKSVDCIVDFLLFCMTFVVCLLIFIWCLYTFFTDGKKHSMWKHVLSTIAILAIIWAFAYCVLQIFDTLKAEEDKLNKVEQSANTSLSSR